MTTATINVTCTALCLFSLAMCLWIMRRIGRSVNQEIALRYEKDRLRHKGDRP